jgi:phosphoribosyl 1,2-cyclic phosphate phosphodiesterase
VPVVSLEFLGSGTSQGVPVIACSCAICTSSDPRDARLRSSVLLRAEGRQLLIDAGPDLRAQMLRSRIRSLDAVLLTHEHMDHVGGIDELRSFNFSQGRAMDIHASEQTLAAVRHMFHYAFGAKRYPGTPILELHQITDAVFRVADVPVTPIPVMHQHMPVLGFRIGGLAYITDAKTISQQAMDRLQDLEVLVLNALRIDPHPSHLNLEEALQLAARIGARRTYFTHISHLLGTHASINAQLPPDVELAYDGLVVEASY